MTISFVLVIVPVHQRMAINSLSFISLHYGQYVYVDDDDDGVEKKQ